MDFREKRKEYSEKKLKDLFKKKNIRFGVYDTMDHIVSDPSKYTNGPEWLDGLEHKWREGEMLGILSGPGVGKTSLS